MDPILAIMSCIFTPFISKVLMTFRLNIGVILTETKKTETVPTTLPLL